MTFGINQTIVKNGTTAEVSVTTDSFTATAGKLLTARGSCYAGTGDDTSTVAISDSQSHTWTPINERSQNDDGGALNPPPVKAWWTVAAGGSMTVTTTRVNAVGFAHVCVVREWNDADTDDPIAAIAEGSATTNPVTASLDTTGVTGAIGCFESVDWGETSLVPSEDADTTLDYAIANADIQGSFSGHRTFGAGGVYTLGTDSPSAGDFNWIAYAVRPGSTMSTVGLTTATVTLTAQALTATPGMVTVALTAATVSLTGQAFAATPGMVTVALTTAAVTLTAAELTASPGMVSVALTSAALSLAAQSLTATPGNITVALTPPAVTFAAQPLTATPNMVTVALTAAVVTFSAVPLFNITTGFFATGTRTQFPATSTRGFGGG